MSENDEFLTMNTVVQVNGAGSVEVNGDYVFCSIKSGAGSYKRLGEYLGREVTFYLYKCNVQNNGSQWFISITPEGMEPGTKHDTDFYYALPKSSVELLPPTSWMVLSNMSSSKPPPPIVRCVTPALPPLPDDIVFDEAPPPESDSDHEGSSSALQDDDLINEESYANTPGNSPHRPGYE